MTHAAAAIALMPEDFRTAVREILLAAWVTPLDAADTALDPVRYWRDFESVTGTRLDVVGLILRVQRQARSDADYRRALRTEIMILRSDGLPETVLAIVREHLGIAAGGLLLWPSYPCGFVLYRESEDTDPLQWLADTVRRSRAAGVNGQIVTRTAGEDTTRIPGSTLILNAFASHDGDWPIDGGFLFESIHDYGGAGGWPWAHARQT